MDFDGNFITDDFIRHALLSPRQSEKQGNLHTRITFIYFKFQAPIYILRIIYFIIEQDINTVSTQFNQGRYDLSINDLKANIEFSPMKNKKWSLKHISQKIVEELNKRPMQVQELTKLFLEEMINSNYCLDLEKDKQNLKRRIYDAVNVLTAIQIIVKDSQDNLSKGKGPQLNRRKSDLMKRKLELQKSKVEKGEYATSLVHEIDTYKDIIKYQKSMARSTQDQIHINFPFTAIYTSLLGKNNEEVVIEHNLTKQIFKMQSKNPFRTYNEVEMAQKLLSIKLNQQQ